MSNTPFTPHPAWRSTFAFKPLYSNPNKDYKLDSMLNKYAQVSNPSVPVGQKK